MGLIGIVAVVVTAYGLSQFNLQNPQAVVSFLSAEVWLTTFLVMVIPLALVLALGEGPPVVRSGGAIAVGMMMVCLLGTQSRAGLVALIGELWVVAWFIRSVSAKVVAVLVTACVIAAVMLVFNDGAIPVAGVSTDIASSLPVKKGVSSVLHRFEIWGFALSEIAKHWLVGIGYGNLSYLFYMARIKKLSCQVIMPFCRQEHIILFSIWRSMSGFRGCCCSDGFLLRSSCKLLLNIITLRIGYRKRCSWALLVVLWG